MYRFISKFFRRELYPELRKAGGFGIALNAAFESINSTLRVTVDSHHHKLPFAYCMVKEANKFSQIYLGAEEKIYMPDFWRDGVCLAHGKTEDIFQLVQVVDYWLTQNVSTLELSSHFSFVKPADRASAFEENREVEYKWMLMLADDDHSDLKEFLTLASKNEVLNKLFPFTSLFTLLFSKCTGYPYDTANLPEVTSIKYMHALLPENITEYAKNRYENAIQHGSVYVVTKNRTQYIGQGNAEEVLKIVCDNLPEDIAPARKGTADA